jgi:hypothetical protein
MKKTTNYQLNQWDETDRILREDFNADNAKIDAAIAEAKNRGGYIKLKEFTTAASAARIDLDVSDIDFSQWQKICMDVHLLGNGGVKVRLSESGSLEYQYQIGVCNSVDNQMASINSNTSDSHSNDARLIFPVCRRPDKQATALEVCLGFQLGTDYNMKFSAIKTVYFLAENSNVLLQPGCTVTVWGVN